MSDGRADQEAAISSSEWKWLLKFSRVAWTMFILLRVGFFLSEDHVAKFSAATHIPETVAVGLAVLLALAAVAMTVEGFVRPPGRFMVGGCLLVAQGYNFDWSVSAEAILGIAMVSVGLVVEIMFYRLMVRRQRVSDRDVGAGAFRE